MASKVSVTKGLNASLPGFLPVHCVYHLLKSRMFTRHRVNIKDWIYRLVLHATQSTFLFSNICFHLLIRNIFFKSFILNLLFRLGIAKKTELKIIDNNNETITNFLEDCGLQWGARKDVIVRSGLAIIETIETLNESGINKNNIKLFVVFDEFYLKLTLFYEGKQIHLTPSKHVSSESILDDDKSIDEIMNNISGRLILKLADKVNSNDKLKDSGSCILKIEL